MDSDQSDRWAAELNGPVELSEWLDDLSEWLADAVLGYQAWVEDYDAFEVHPSQRFNRREFIRAFSRFDRRLRNNYPFFHPSYAGQMLKPPHPVAVAGYLRAMLINPNNHALDGGPATAEMEKQVVASIAAMFGMDTHLGHLTTSGTIANLEALFVARQLHPDKAIAFSVESHYTHARMCGLLRVETCPVPVDETGRMDLDALAELLSTGKVGTVVATAGTTGLGSVDHIEQIVPIARRYGVRVHVDAAYGGFFALLAAEDRQDESGLVDPAPWRAIADCDSVVVDPHKHGLQPYGCGAVLFADPTVARFYLHDSPYTYFTSDSLHLGQISLECSRPGAAAAALWLTLRVFPLTRSGLGEILAAGRRAAMAWAAAIEDCDVLRLYQQPQLDIVSYFPSRDGFTLAQIDQASYQVLTAGMSASQDPVFLSLLEVDSAAFSRRHPDLLADIGGVRVLRSVLMKPESETYLDTLHHRVVALARQAVA